MNRTYCLLIGDGFTKDFIGKSFNTSKPLSNFESQSISYKGLFTRISPVVDELQFLANELGDDFEAMRVFLQDNAEDTSKECQLRRFLAIAYSKLQLEINKKDKTNWKWFQWLNQNKDGLAFAITFNYDLLLENTLKDCGMSFFRTGSTELQEGIPVFKPHGSIDFDLPSVHYEVTRSRFDWMDTANELIQRQQTWGAITTLNEINGAVKAVPQKHWLLPRFQADIIPPLQENYQRHLNWVETGYNLYDGYTSVSDFIIIGHSYGFVDRPEVDHFLERLDKQTTVHIVNPNPSEDLITKLDLLGLKSRTITDFTSLPW